MIAETWAAYKTASAAKKWLPYAIGGVGGLLLAGLLIGVPSYYMVSGARATAAARSAERDIYKASAEVQADAVHNRERSIDRLNAQTLVILKDWRDTRADALAAEAKTRNLAAQYQAITADLMEKSRAENADPVGLALDALGRLCRAQQARTGAAAGGC